MRKSKVMKALLTLGMSIATATSVAAIAACTHEHTSDGKWKTDKNQHWHEATCSDHPGEKYDIANHIDEGKDGKCDVCEYVMVTPSVETWTVTLKNGTATHSTVKIKKGSKLTASQIPSIAKEGYTFDGWFDAQGNKLTTDTVISADITFTAKWTENQVTPPDPSEETWTVTFVNGEETDTLEILKGAKLTAAQIPTPTKSGYTFDGWFDAQNNKLTTDTEITSDITFTAKWTENQVTPPDPTEEKWTVTLVNGGDTSTVEVVKGNKLAAAQIPELSKTGYTFDGWFDTDNNKLTTDTEITSDITFTAKWTEKVVTNIDLDKPSLSLVVGGTATLKATVTPADALDADITWESSDDDIATVVNGVVTARAAGDVTIIAKTSNGVTAECEVTVLAQQIHAESFTIVVGDGSTDRVTLSTSKPTETIKVVVNPEGCTDEVVWTSSDETVATVTPDANDPFSAVVTMIGQGGTAPITISAKVGNLEAKSVFCTADTYYGTLINDKDHLIINENFVNYSNGDKLTQFSNWGTKGVYGGYDLDKDDPDTVSYDTHYVKITTEANGNNRAEMVDAEKVGETTVKTATKLVIDFGEVDGVIKGYANLKLSSTGNSWTFVRFFGSSAGKTNSEVFGLRTNGSANGGGYNLNYRLDGDKPTAEGINNAVVIKDNATYRLYYEFDLETGRVIIKINSQDFLDITTDISELKGVQFYSSNGGARPISVDNIAVTNVPLTVEAYKTKVLGFLEDLQAGYDSANYSEANWTTLTDYVKAAEDAVNAEGATKADMLSAYETAVGQVKGVETLAQAQLREAKETALAALAAYDKSDYTLSETEVAAIISEAETAITAATTVEAVNAAKSKADSDLAEIDNDETIFAAAKAKALDDLSKEKGGASNFTTNEAGFGVEGYRANYNNIDTYQSAITTGTTGINNVVVSDGNYVAAMEQLALKLTAALKGVDDCLDNDQIYAQFVDEAKTIVRSYKQAEINAIPECDPSIEETDTENYYVKENVITLIGEVLANRQSNIDTANGPEKYDTVRFEVSTAVMYKDDVLYAFTHEFSEIKEHLRTSLNAYYTSYTEGIDDQEVLAAAQQAYNDGIANIEAVTSGKFTLVNTFRSARNSVALYIRSYTYINQITGLAAEKTEAANTQEAKDAIAAVLNACKEEINEAQEVNEVIAAVASATETINAISALDARINERVNDVKTTEAITEQVKTGVNELAENGVTEVGAVVDAMVQIDTLAYDTVAAVLNEKAKNDIKSELVTQLGNLADATDVAAAQAAAEEAIQLIVTTLESTSFTVTFNAGDGVAVAPIQVVYKNKPESLPTPEKEGYKFLGWKLNDEVFNIESVVTDNITVVAEWKQADIVINYYNASNLMHTDKFFSEDNNVTAYKAYLSGYTFGGWYSDNSLTDGTEFNFTSVAAGTHDVYGKFTVRPASDYPANGIESWVASNSTDANNITNADDYIYFDLSSADSSASYKTGIQVSNSGKDFTAAWISSEVAKNKDNKATPFTITLKENVSALKIYINLEKSDGSKRSGTVYAAVNGEVKQEKSFAKNDDKKTTLDLTDLKIGDVIEIYMQVGGDGGANLFVYGVDATIDASEIEGDLTVNYYVDETKETLIGSKKFHSFLSDMTLTNEIPENGRREFLYWYSLAEDGVTEIKYGDVEGAVEFPTTLEANATLEVFAKWGEETDVEINYYNYDGTLLKSLRQMSNKELSYVPDPLATDPKIGEFDGWYVVDAAGEPVAKITDIVLAPDTTYTVRPFYNEYDLTVVFVVNGVETSHKQYANEVVKNLPDNPDNTAAAKFVGWYIGSKDVIGDTEFDPTKADYDSNLTLYVHAKFVEYDLIITYYLDKDKYDAGEVLGTAKFVKALDTVEIANPKKQGYTFKNWVNSEGDADIGDLSTLEGTTVKIYADWTEGESAKKWTFASTDTEVSKNGTITDPDNIITVKATGNKWQIKSLSTTISEYNLNVTNARVGKEIEISTESETAVTVTLFVLDASSSGARKDTGTVTSTYADGTTSTVNFVKTDNYAKVEITVIKGSNVKVKTANYMVVYAIVIE